MEVEDGLVLHVVSGDAERFERRWRIAWSRIPAKDKEHLLAYWSSMYDGLYYANPLILMSSPEEMFINGSKHGEQIGLRAKHFRENHTQANCNTAVDFMGRDLSATLPG